MQEEFETASKHSESDTQGLLISFSRHSVSALWEANPITHSHDLVELQKELLTAVSHCSVLLQESPTVSRIQLSKFEVTLYPSSQEQVSFQHWEFMTASEHCASMSQELSICLKVHSELLLEE